MGEGHPHHEDHKRSSHRESDNDGYMRHMSDETSDTCDNADAENAANVLLAEARLALASAEARVSGIETKASWLLAGLVPSLGLVSVGVYSQANGTDLDKALPLATATTGGLVIALLLAAIIHALKVVDLSEFHLINKAWLVESIEDAEQERGHECVPLTLGLAHATLSAATSSAGRANAKIESFKPTMLLIRLGVWSVVPYAIFTIAQVARNAI